VGLSAEFVKATFFDYSSYLVSSYVISFVTQKEKKSLDQNPPSLLKSRKEGNQTGRRRTSPKPKKAPKERTNPALCPKKE